MFRHYDRPIRDDVSDPPKKDYDFTIQWYLRQPKEIVLPVNAKSKSRVRWKN